MQLRAQHTGLTVELAEREGIKEVAVRYPGRQAAASG